MILLVFALDELQLLELLLLLGRPLHLSHWFSLLLLHLLGLLDLLLLLQLMHLALEVLVLWLIEPVADASHLVLPDGCTEPFSCSSYLLLG